MWYLRGRPLLRLLWFGDVVVVFWLVREMWWLVVGSVMGLWAGMLIGEDELAAIFASLSLILCSGFCVFYCCRWEICNRLKSKKIVEYKVSKVICDPSETIKRCLINVRSLSGCCPCEKEQRKKSRKR